MDDHVTVRLTPDQHAKLLKRSRGNVQMFRKGRDEAKAASEKPGIRPVYRENYQRQARERAGWLQEENALLAALEAPTEAQK